MTWWPWISRARNTTVRRERVRSLAALAASLDALYADDPTSPMALEAELPEPPKVVVPRPSGSTDALR